MRKAVILILTVVLTLGMLSGNVLASDMEEDKNQPQSTPISGLELNVKSALLMEAGTGKILYQKNELDEASPASVTKIMTLLLVSEALDNGIYKLDDKVTISSYAASMGGSQVFLEEGEVMTVEELIKCTVIASANDAAVALAELTAGSEKAFVSKMNERAKELGLVNTNFENATGLDDTTTAHYSSAKDIAIMSRELIKHDIILNYSSIWQDTIRNGEFTLTNTNRLVRYYSGCNGLKTGSTDKAGYCVSTTAKRGDLQLIAVVMGANSRDERNAAARAMLDFGFASYALRQFPSRYLENVPVIGGKVNSVGIYSRDFTVLTDKGKSSKIEEKFFIPESISAPMEKGSVIGRIEYYLDGELLGESDIVIEEDIEEVSFFELLWTLIKNIITGKKP